MLSSLRLTLLQPDVLWEAPAENLARYERLIAAEAAAQKPHIVLLPELFATGFSMNTALAELMSGDTVKWMRHIAQQHRCIVGGSVMIREEERVYNRFVWMQPDGMAHHYDKRHRFAYGGEEKHFEAGDRRVIVQVMGWKICLQICYDLRFPVWSRNTPGAAQYDALFYIASWPARRAQAWKTLLPARAIENQAYVVGLNRTGTDGNNLLHSGDSAVYGPDGTPLWEGGEAAHIHTITLDYNTLHDFRQQFPFLRDADGFSLL